LDFIPVPIPTQRLILRVFTDNDFQPLRELETDPAVLRYRSRKHISPEMTLEFLDRAQCASQALPRLFYAYAVIQRATGSWLGQCGLTVLATELTEAFLWYSLLPRYWGHGYMAEAVNALLIAGATKFKLHRIFAECHPDNWASIRVMEKAGLKPEGQVQLLGAAGQAEERIRYGLAGIDLKSLAGSDVQIELPW
jgi:RimJ/RimL family protein N-acetyltransferase